MREMGHFGLDLSQKPPKYWLLSPECVIWLCSRSRIPAYKGNGKKRSQTYLLHSIQRQGFFLSPLNTGAFIEKNPLRCCQNGSETSGHGPLGVSCGSGTEALAVESRWGQGCWLGSFWCILQMLDWIGIWGFWRPGLFLVLCARFWWEVSYNWSCSV